MTTKVSVVKCNSYGEKEVYKKVKEAIDLIGGISIKKGSKVLVKPNLLSAHKPEDAITTHPSVVDAVCRILKKKGVEIIVGDSCGMGVDGGTKQVLEVSGINKVAKKNKAKAVSLETSSKLIKDSNAKILKAIRVSSFATEVDYIVNVPKLKTHTLMKYTGAVKNIFGIVPGANKSRYHSLAPGEEKFGNLLVDIYQNFVPALNVMDGIVGIEGNGPGSGGIKKKTGIILASRDAVALDLVASKIIGFGPMEIKTNKYAVERGLFKDKAEVVGEANVLVHYKKPIPAATFVPGFVQKIFYNYFKLKPYVKKGICVGCKTCFFACPAKAIAMNKLASIDLKKCITCYCCHELCPYNAIELKMPFIIEMLVKIRRLIKV